ncbi:serine protease [Bacteroidota bacterium]
MKKDRLELYKKLEEKRNSKLLIYITSNRRGLETQIGNDALSFFTNQLDKIGDVNKISLYLFTRGGDTIAAWTILNLIRNFCEELEIIIPSACHSAGTLMCLGANKIVMTKQATLGPIDPSINSPLNPKVMQQNPLAPAIPVNVEQIYAFFEMAKQVSKSNDSNSLINLYVDLAKYIHPTVLGAVFRSRSQIRILAERLLKYNRDINDDKRNEIINFLCSESGSHDYTINRKEAEEMGLKIEKPDDETYKIIKAIYDDIEKELELINPYNPISKISTNKTCSYKFRRGLIETIEGGTDVYISEGQLIKVQTPIMGQQMMPQETLQDNRSVDEWIHEN